MAEARVECASVQTNVQGPFLRGTYPEFGRCGCGSEAAVADPGFGRCRIGRLDSAECKPKALPNEWLQRQGSNLFVQVCPNRANMPENTDFTECIRHLRLSPSDCSCFAELTKKCTVEYCTFLQAEVEIMSGPPDYNRSGTGLKLLFGMVSTR